MALTLHQVAKIASMGEESVALSDWTLRFRESAPVAMARGRSAGLLCARSRLHSGTVTPYPPAPSSPPATPSPQLGDPTDNPSSPT